MASPRPSSLITPGRTTETREFLRAADEIEVPFRSIASACGWHVSRAGEGTIFSPNTLNFLIHATIDRDDVVASMRHCVVGLLQELSSFQSIPHCAIINEHYLRGGIHGD